MKNCSARLLKFQNAWTAHLSRIFFCLLVAGFVSSPLQKANAQTPGVLYTWPSTTSDWVKNFGAGSTSATLANSGGALQITETSTAAGGSQAFSDGFNTIRDTPASFGSGCCGGLELTGLSSLEFDMGHNGVGNVNVQFFVQASPGSAYVALGPDLAVAPGINTYSVPLAGLTADQIAYIRTMGINIRDHAGESNLIWTIQEVRSVGTPLTSRIIADHDGGATDFDGVICNFDCGAVSGGNGGQNNSGMSIVSGALEWVDLGGGPGVAITYGNGTQNSGGSFNARPVDLSNYDIATIRMKATGADASVFVQFYMQTGSGFSYQSYNWGNLPVDGSYHDLVIPLAGITSRNFVDTSGINLGGHASDLMIDIDSVVYSVIPPTPCIQVVKLCNYPPNSPTCFPAGANIDFTGYVTNCGNIRLTNVTVVDCRPLLGAGLLDTNGFPLIQPLTLNPGQAIGFRGSF